MTRRRAKGCSWMVPGDARDSSSCRRWTVIQLVSTGGGDSGRSLPRAVAPFAGVGACRARASPDNAIGWIFLWAAIAAGIAALAELSMPDHWACDSGHGRRSWAGRRPRTETSRGPPASSVPSTFAPTALPGRSPAVATLATGGMVRAARASPLRS